MTRTEDTRSPSRSGGRPAAQAGSAYVITLLALVLLTIVGLSLTLVTQTELQIGANEGTINRVFYAADSGISEATARALTNADYQPQVLTIDEPYGNPLISPQYQLEASAFLPILDAPCNLCEINNVGTYSDRAYRKVNHAITVQASRMGGASNVPLAAKTIATMVETQPWRLSPPEALLILDDPTELQKIKF
jgi:hypothetical protein